MGHPANVAAILDAEDGRLCVLFECGAHHTISREEAQRLASDPEAAAAFLRRHTAWATERRYRR